MKITINDCVITTHDCTVTINDTRNGSEFIIDAQQVFKLRVVKTHPSFDFSFDEELAKQIAAKDIAAELDSDGLLKFYSAVNKDIVIVTVSKHEIILNLSNRKDWDVLHDAIKCINFSHDLLVSSPNEGEDNKTAKIELLGIFTLTVNSEASYEDLYEDIYISFRKDRIIISTNFFEVTIPVDGERLNLTPLRNALAKEHEVFKDLLSDLSVWDFHKMFSRDEVDKLKEKSYNIIRKSFYLHSGCVQYCAKFLEWYNVNGVPMNEVVDRAIDLATAIFDKHARYLSE